MLADTVEAEVEAFIAAHADLADEAGRRRVVRHDYQPEREVQTGIGAVAVRRPRVRDRQPDAGRGRIRFTSSILPPYLRRAKSVEDLLPWLYLKGISTGDFGEALAALLGPDAPGLSATTVIRLKTAWAEEYERWLRRDLSAKRYVYLWADGVYFSPRFEHDQQCLLVIIGADEIGNKDIVGLSARYHYLGYKTLVGAQMRYAVHDRDGWPLAMLGFSTAAWKLAPRDTFIGWTPQLRKKNLPFVANRQPEVPHPALDRDPQSGFAHPRPHPPAPARRLDRALQHHARAHRDFRRDPAIYRRGLQGIGLDPCRHHPGARALRPGQAVRQAEKGCLAPAPATGLETHAQSKIDRGE